MKGLEKSVGGGEEGTRSSSLLGQLRDHRMRDIPELLPDIGLKSPMGTKKPADIGGSPNSVCSMRQPTMMKAGAAVRSGRPFTQALYEPEVTASDHVAIGEKSGLIAA